MTSQTTNAIRSGCFTGHRKLTLSEMDFCKKQISQIVTDLVKKGCQTFYTGGALGFDTLAAECLFDLREKGLPIRILIAVPCKDQDGKWSEEEKEQYQKMLSRADEVILVSDAPYSSDCMMKRNHYLVDHADVVLSFYNPTHKRSGTGATVRYAIKTGKPLIDLYAALYPAS